MLLLLALVLLLSQINFIHCQQVGSVITLAGGSQGFLDGQGTSALFNLQTGISVSPDASYALIADYLI